MSGETRRSREKLGEVEPWAVLPRADAGASADADVFVHDAVEGHVADYTRAPAVGIAHNGRPAGGTLAVPYSEEPPALADRLVADDVSLALVVTGAQRDLIHHRQPSKEVASRWPLKRNRKK